VLVIIRALFYWQIGSAVSWSLKLDLVAVVPNFRGYHFLPAMVFSVLSLARMLGIFYFWLLFLVMINRRPADSDPVLKMLRLHVGRAARWPWPIQLFLPLLLVTGRWMAVHPLLMQVESEVPDPGFSAASPHRQLCLSGCQPVLGFRWRHRGQLLEAPSPDAFALWPMGPCAAGRNRPGAAAAPLDSKAHRGLSGFPQANHLAPIGIGAAAPATLLSAALP
jgi:hypothetical protein